MSRPYVVVIASEKGGVGKTTIATNLAVYLKALREDLPVTIASFDNHFSVEQMFAIGSRPAGSVADLLGDDWDPGAIVLGEYGVQYLASERRLQTPDREPGWLRQRIQAADFDGLLILDTRPILDWFTEAALLAADLVIVPIKDRAALVNAAALRQVLDEVNRSDRLWLLPSLVDSRARLNSEVRVHEYLRYAARERDYQVLDLFISKSPKVESLNSGFSSRIPPVLTHARQTAVHGQLRQLAELVLDGFDSSGEDLREPGSVENTVSGPLAGSRRLVRECPLCSRSSLAEAGHFFFDLRSRRRGLVHEQCAGRKFAGFELDDGETPEGLIGFHLDGPGLLGPEPRLTVHCFSAEGDLLSSEVVDLEAEPALAAALTAMLGRPLDQAYRELALLTCSSWHSAEQMEPGAMRRFGRLRHAALRELRRAGYL